MYPFESLAPVLTLVNLICVDGSEYSLQVVERARRLLHTHDTAIIFTAYTTPLQPVHFFDTEFTDRKPLKYEEFHKALQQQCQECVNKCALCLEKCKDIRTVVQETSNIPEAIVKYASDNDVDMIVRKLFTS